ncbi:hypothetical protein [Methylobacterium sp. J-068]|uniref:hypothetical protein n=1 Tax=Methylobacterium sp. J-068 TaxID=2836649 RepID=UPI001FB8681B|nr:hypothetical protein [Methylobacterium sp. J-068]MCJ2032710.1 hypothetical protein [Methylobacterium sp. J-068]
MASPSVEQILLTEGPCLTSRLCAILEAGGLSSSAARQRVSRAPAKVKRLDGLVFPHRVRFAYHESQFNSEGYWNGLLNCLSESNTAYMPAIKAVEARGGIVPQSHFGIICGAPLKQKKHLSPETIIERLTNVRLLKKTHVEGIGDCISLGDKIGGDEASEDLLRARLLAEKILLNAVKEWAKNLGLASYNKIEVRDEQPDNPRVGTFSWDLTGPSYLQPMRRTNKQGKIQPGFLVCDVALTGGVPHEVIVNSFIKKISTLQRLNLSTPILPILITDGYDREAFSAGRSHGIVMGTVKSLFGHDVARGLDILLRVLTSAAATAAQSPEAITEIFSKLSTIEGAAGNLRGPLFEMIVGFCVKRVEGGSIEIGDRVTNPSNGAKAEIDVRLTRENKQFHCYECKGYHAGNRVNLAEVEKWAKEKVPAIYGYMKSHGTFKDYKASFNFWTTSSFNDDAAEFLVNYAKRTKKYSIGFKDGKAVRQYAAEASSKSIIEILDQHYLAEPLTKIIIKHNPSNKIPSVEQQSPASALIEEVDFEDEL